MFGSANSIEPVGPVAVAESKAARRRVDEPPVREATAADMAASARRQKASDTRATAIQAEPVKALPVTAPGARTGLFGRREAEPVRPDAVSERHNLYVAEKLGSRRYYADYQQKQEVMRSSAARITTKQDDRQTVAAVLDLAEERGWQTLRLRGTESFRREAWVQAQVRGMETEGYKPTATDTQEVARRLNAVAPKEGLAERTTAKPAETVPPQEPAAATATAKAVPIAAAPTPVAAVPVASETMAPKKAARVPAASDSRSRVVAVSATDARLTPEAVKSLKAAVRGAKPAAALKATQAATSAQPPARVTSDELAAAKAPADVATHDAKIAARTPEQGEALHKAAFGSLEKSAKTAKEMMDRLDRMTPDERKAALLEMAASPAAAQKNVWGGVENAGRIGREAAAKSIAAEKAGERASVAASA